MIVYDTVAYGSVVQVKPRKVPNEKEYSEYEDTMVKKNEYLKKGGLTKTEKIVIGVLTSIMAIVVIIIMFFTVYVFIARQDDPIDKDYEYVRYTFFSPLLFMTPIPIPNEDLVEKAYYCKNSCDDSDLIAFKNEGNPSNLIINESGEFEVVVYYKNKKYISFYITIIDYSNKCKERIIVPYGITRIEDNMFKDCVKLTELTLTDTVEEIGAYAFTNCTSLEKIIFSRNIIKVGDYAFSNCTSLNNTNIARIKNFPFNTGKGIFSGCTSIKTLELNISVPEISEELFKDCTSLTTIKLIGDISTLGKQSFYNCTSLKNIIYTSSSRVQEQLNIAERAFYNNISLETLTLTMNQEVKLVVYDKAFYGCTSLIGFDGYVTVFPIGTYSFANCIKLNNIKLSPLIETILDHSFENCDSLLTIEIPQNVVEIKPNAFYNCTSLEIVTLPLSLQRIHDYSFASCPSLYLVKIAENSVLAIGENFDFNSALTEIGRYAFSDCINLTSFQFVSSIKKINDFAFYNTKISELPSLMNNLEIVGKKAFYGCEFVILSIPASLTQIGIRAFSNNRLLMKIEVAQDNPNYLAKHDILFSKDMELILYPSNTGTPYAIFNYEVKKINIGSFEYINNLKTITFAESLLFESNDVFSLIPDLEAIGVTNCLTIEQCAEKTKDLVFFYNAPISESKNILYSLYENCKITDQKYMIYPVILETVSFPIYDKELINLVTYINNNLEIKVEKKLDPVDGEYFLDKGNYTIKVYYLNNMYSETDIWVISGTEDLCKENYYAPYGTTELPSICYNCEIVKTVNLPETLTTTIKRDHFYLCTKLERVFISDSIKEIEHDAFEKNSLLQYVDFGHSLVTIGDRAFSKATYLETVILPDTVTFIGSSVFSGCSKLNTVVLPNNLEVIPNNLFKDCPKLSNINMPTKLREIGERAFFSCYSIHEIIIPKSVVKIANRAFELCLGLTKIEFEEGSQLEEFGEEVFKVASLTKITIPPLVKELPKNFFTDGYFLIEVVLSENLERIGDYAFKDACALMDVVMTRSVKYIGVGAFIGTKIEKFDFASVNVIASFAFQNLNLSNLNLDYSNDIREIGEGAFSGCSLEAITIKSINEVKLGPGAFSENPYLKTVNLGLLNTTSIPDMIFYNDSQLKSVVFPINTLKDIGISAFEGCINLESIKLPDTITLIGSKAFYGNSMLKDVSLPKSLQVVRENAFYNCDSLINLTVYDNTIIDGENVFCGSNLELVLIKNDSEGRSDKTIHEIGICPESLVFIDENDDPLDTDINDSV